jgi:hypothetical protein
VSPLLYEINTRCWLRELSEHSGRPVTLADVPDSQFAQWQAFGFTHIWLMGVWTVGPRSRQEALRYPGLADLYTSALPDWHERDVAGSPYAIADYQVPRELGGLDGLEQFRRKLRADGMKLLLDFVPNHLGLDHRWVTLRPGLFVQSAQERTGTFPQKTTAGSCWLAHGRDPHCGPWTDTVQLDYRLGETRAAMTELLLDIAQWCDGVRCDMAMLLLNDVFAESWAQFPAAQPPGETEFWSEAISAVRREHPAFLFLAESYWGTEARLQALGFDFTYDKELYDAVVSGDGAAVQKRLLNNTPEFCARNAHFIENHDERRIASLLDLAPHRAAALLVLALPGMRFLHEGQLTGARLRSPVQLSRRHPEPPRPEIESFYRDLLGALRESAVGRGSAELIEPRVAWPDNSVARNVIVVQWQCAPPEFDLAVVNFSPEPVHCRVPLRIANLAGHHWSIRDLLGGARHECAGQELEARGVLLELPGHAAQLLHCAPSVWCR